MNYLISSVTSFYCETKAIAFINVADSSQLHHEHLYPGAEEGFCGGITVQILITDHNWEDQQKDLTITRNIYSQKLALASKPF